MGYDVKIVADSIGPFGHRLTTMALTYPLIVHAELMTYRVFSRCVASNRAIPVGRMIEQVLHDPFIPDQWPANQAGMQPLPPLPYDKAQLAQIIWLDQRDAACTAAIGLKDLGVHKQMANRLLAPWIWTTAIVSSTEWANFFAQRLALVPGTDTPMAQREMYRLASWAYQVYSMYIPTRLRAGDWHLPYYGEKGQLGKHVNISPLRHVIEPWYKSSDDVRTGNDHRVDMTPVMVSVGHCARVSYLRNDNDFTETQDFELAARLIDSRPMHASPLEHAAQCTGDDKRYANFTGWYQFRKCFVHENITEYNGPIPAVN